MCGQSTLPWRSNSTAEFRRHGLAWRRWRTPGTWLSWFSASELARAEVSVSKWSEVVTGSTCERNTTKADTTIAPFRQSKSRKLRKLHYCVHDNIPNTPVTKAILHVSNELTRQLKQQRELVTLSLRGYRAHTTYNYYWYYYHCCCCCCCCCYYYYYSYYYYYNCCCWWWWWWCYCSCCCCYY